MQIVEHNTNSGQQTFSTQFGDMLICYAVIACFVTTEHNRTQPKK